METKVFKRYPLGNKRFIWKQREYVNSVFSCAPHHDKIDGDPQEVLDKCVKNLKDAGFNMLELGWSGHKGAWAAVEACEKYEINLVFQDMSMMGGMQYMGTAKPTTEEEVSHVVSLLKDKKYTIGYYVWDEPSGTKVLNEARRQMDLLEKYDPEALLFTVALPHYNHAGDDRQGLNWDNGRYAPYVREFAKLMDPPVHSFDYYPVGNYFKAWEGHTYNYENQLDDTFMWLDMGLHRQVALENNLPFWFYYQGFSLYPVTEYFIFPMVRCFMYAAILHGAKGLQNYTAGQEGNKLLDAAGNPGEFIPEQTKINTEVKALGNTLMALTSKLVYHSDDLLPDCELIKPYVNTIEESAIFAGKLPKRCSIGELEDDYGNRYAVILNRDYEKELKAILELKEGFRIYEVSKKDGRQYVLHENVTAMPIELAPGDAVVVRIQKADEDAFAVEYELAERA